VTIDNDFELSTLAVDALRGAYLRIRNVAAANRLWNLRLTDRDRRKLGSDFQTAYRDHGGTVGMWQKLHGGTVERAIVEANVKLQFLNDLDREWLLGELRETLKPPGSSVKPRWDPVHGELSLEGHIIRMVRPFRTPSNIQQILDQFRHHRWRKKVENPLGGQGQQQLHQALRTLNKGLQRISIHSEDGGKSIRWSDR
jgi:hypothetical protein